MGRQPGEENLTEREILILDLTDEWHDSDESDEGFGYTLVEFVAAKLGVSYDQAGQEIYGPHWKDGALL
jgi:hypothetical protein